MKKTQENKDTDEELEGSLYSPCVKGQHIIWRHRVDQMLSFVVSFTVLLSLGKINQEVKEQTCGAADTT